MVARRQYRSIHVVALVVAVAVTVAVVTQAVTEHSLEPIWTLAWLPAVIAAVIAPSERARDCLTRRRRRVGLLPPRPHDEK
jgi:hypothetical protein